MKRIFTAGVLGLIGILISHSVRAVTFSIEPDLINRQLHIVYDPEPERFPFLNGVANIELRSETPGVIRFTDAVVHNPSLNGTRRWVLAQTAVADDSVLFDAISILTTGMPINAPSLYATVDYEILTAPGVVAGTQLNLSPYFSPLLSDEVAFFDALYAPFGEDVGDRVNLTGYAFNVPEPGSVALAISGLAAYVLRCFAKVRRS